MTGLIKIVLQCLLLAMATTAAAGPDWLLDPTPFKASFTDRANELVLENGLARRVIRLAPNAATIELQNLATGEHLLRAIAPEARGDDQRRRVRHRRAGRRADRKLH